MYIRVRSLKNINELTSDCFETLPHLLLSQLWLDNWGDHSNSFSNYPIFSKLDGTSYALSLLSFFYMLSHWKDWWDICGSSQLLLLLLSLIFMLSLYLFLFHIFSFFLSHLYLILFTHLQYILYNTSSHKSKLLIIDV